MLKFRVQLHQLTTSAFAQFSKYLWVVLSFGGKPSDDSFVKRYELHYQSKKVDVDGVEKYQQFGCINFHARQGVRAKLTPAIKNKWSARWTKVWFYCKVPTHVCTQGGKSYVSSAFA
jgi:lysyl-tRNA synthetase class I